MWKTYVEELLVQQGIDHALEKIKHTSLKVEKWVPMKKKVVNTIKKKIIKYFLCG